MVALPEPVEGPVPVGGLLCSNGLPALVLACPPEDGSLEGGLPFGAPDGGCGLEVKPCLGGVVVEPEDAPALVLFFSPNGFVGPVGGTGFEDPPC